MKKIKKFKQFINQTENTTNDSTHQMKTEYQEYQNYMFFQNLKQIRDHADEILSMNLRTIDEMITEYDWIEDHITISKDNLNEVYNFIKNNS